MCGICGAIDYKAGGSVSQELLGKMCVAMRHRGPDDFGVYCDNSARPAAGLGHRRLSIIDLSAAGHQPMSNEDGTLWLVLNGEIYNYPQLRSELEGKGHKFRSHTDTEVVVHLYEEYGRDCVKRLRGMFAFALWDKPRRSLMLARDRLGKKPLLYTYKNGRFSFASEFCALLACGDVSRDIDRVALRDYLVFGFIPAPKSIYRDVLKLMPAHTLVLKDGKTSLECYWKLDYSKKIKISEEVAQAEFIRLFREAVKIRLYSDVPMGALLSGGIDSGAVTAFMAEEAGARINTFSIGFDEAGYDELPYARKVAALYGTKHHESMVTPEAQNLLPQLVEHYGEPYADSSSIPTYYACKLAAGYVKVVLNGDGGDEAFAGYERYQAYLFSEHYRKIPACARKLIRSALNIIPARQDRKDTVKRLQRFAEGVELPGLQRYFYWSGIFGPHQLNGLMSMDFKLGSDTDSYARMEDRLGEACGLNTLDRLLRADTLSSLPNDLLAKVDIAGMANSLELRSPFLDQHIFEFVASLAPEYKLRGMIKKYILKKALRGRLPGEILRRKKMGFGVPVASWLRGKMRGYLEENLLSERSLGRGYFDPAQVKKMVTEHTSGRADHAAQLWALLVLELWHQRFID